MKKILGFLSLSALIAVAGVYYLGSTAFADTAAPPLNPTVSISANSKIESMSFQPINQIQSVLFIGKAGDAMCLIEDKGKMCLVDKGNVKPIAKIIIVLEDGTKLEGKLAAIPKKENCGADSSRLLTDEEMSQVRGEMATPEEIAAYKQSHTQPQK